jgi:hypothetical protein
VVISDLGSLVPPGSLPPGAELPTDAQIEFSIAAKGRVIVLGVGEGFMNGVLNVQPGTSLADQAGYKSAQARSLTNSRTSMYVNVRSAIDLVEAFLPAEELAEWESDIKPYLAPIDGVAASLISNASGNRSRLVITVSQPQ